MVYAKKSLKQTHNLIDLYLSESFYLSIVLWLGLNTYSSSSKVDFFSTLLLVAHYQFYIYAKGALDKVAHRWELPALFVFQIFSFIGLSFSLSISAPLFISIIPCLAGMYYFLYQDGKTPESAQRKSWTLMAIALSSFFIFQGVKESEFLSFNEGICLAVFSLWTLGTIYFGNEFILKQRKNLFDRLRSGKQKIEEVHANKERYFFHDIINHTHGLGLFLETKMSEKKGLSPLDTSRVADEIKLFQTLIRDHFGYSHKDLGSNSEFVNFEFAKMGLFNLVENFLGGDHIDCHMIFKGDIASDFSYQESKRVMVHYPTFHRVMNNLIKNISEEKSKLIEFTFDYAKEGLHITVKNKILSLKENDSYLERELEDIILESNVHSLQERRSGLGLESIHSLVTEVDGSFHFSIEGEYWVSEIFLPRPFEFQKKSAA
ncbi:GHKL domain-containing protein [Halobacteriovorax sp. JY17]|uniref:GHKL domain-containing protein n=1 Tax=Halobacteriovorax sp. JY17 TaxID=2014617 RepID=UPI000C50D8AA|nr:GHKL domain-containing protein [Halobacteriovorax sp. JY17]PIK15639.1 MAG: hypothetical protein CES88_02625 [Halobacteriovorax sp. JY17]